MDSASGREAVLATVAELVAEVMGEDPESLGPISAETSFSRDLELESIELVALAERLQAATGREVDFAGWLSGKSLDEIIALTVGDLVEHILRCRS